MSMTQQDIDEKYMRRCLQLAANGLLTTKPNPMVGAVIVAPSKKNDESIIIGEGFTSPVGGPHAEVNAFASVKKENEYLLPYSTIYVSLEPCSHWGHTPPCCDLIISKHIKRCVCGCVDPFAKVQGRGIKRMRDAGIEVTVGVLEDECKAINKRFMTFNEHKRPYIILKWAQTINGIIGRASLLPEEEGPEERSPLRLSTPFTTMLSHKLRAENDAILVGRGTLEADHPQLNTREWTGKNPERIVLSHHKDGIPDGFTWCNSIEAVMHHLYEEQKQSLIVEGGANVLNDFISQGLCDEIRMEVASFTVSGGVNAPVLPDTATLYKKEEYDGNAIYWFKKQ